MKTLHFKPKLWVALGISIGFLNACSPEKEVIEEETLSFTRDIRPVFFEKLNFNSKQRVREIASFLEAFKKNYETLEENYRAGKFISKKDLENMRIASMYYSFYITAVVRASLDDFITFEDIIGQRTSFYSSITPENPSFKKHELIAMMNRSVQVAAFAIRVNGYNDKVLGTYNVAKQIQGRVNNDQHFNVKESQDNIISYITTTINNYDYFSEWNAFMSQLSLTNYKDSLNTFQNHKMNLVLENLNNRVIPNIPDKYQGIIAPMYKFDINLKKVDWYMNKSVLSVREMEEMQKYISNMNVISEDIQHNRSGILNKWTYRDTFYERLEKLNEVKMYFNAMYSRNGKLNKPELASFFTSKNFLQAYQCYNCHQPFQ